MLHEGMIYLDRCRIERILDEGSMNRAVAMAAGPGKEDADA
jgi:hypothetical protein